MDGLTFVISGILESIKREDTADLIQGYGGKVTHSVSKKKSFIVMGQDPGESKLSKVHCDVQLKRGKKNCEHKHMYKLIFLAVEFIKFFLVKRPF